MTDIAIDDYYERWPNATVGSELYHFLRCRECWCVVANIHEDKVEHARRCGLGASHAGDGRAPGRTEDGEPVRPEWTEEELGEAQGIAHAAAWSTVQPEPDEGWRNSYDCCHEPEMAAAHSAAHAAVDHFPTSPDAYWAAWRALVRWEEEGKPIRGYEAHVPRLSEASVARGGGNPLQRP